MLDPAEYKISPALAVALDLWGQTVKHRAGTITAPRWFILPPEQPACKFDRSSHAKGKRITPKSTADLQRRRADLTGSNNHGGLRLTGYELAQNWGRIVKMERSFPRRPELSPATRKLLLELSGHGSGSQGRPGDIRAVQAAFLSISTMLLGRERWAGAPRDIRSLAAWLFAVPHYLEAETDVAGWCAMRYSGAGLRLPDLIAARDAELRRWIARSNHVMRSIAPTAQWLVGDDWINAEVLDRLAAGAAIEATTELMSFQREFLKLWIGCMVLLRLGEQETEDDKNA